MVWLTLLGPTENILPGSLAPSTFTGPYRTIMIAVRQMVWNKSSWWTLVTNRPDVAEWLVDEVGEELALVEYVRPRWAPPLRKKMVAIEAAYGSSRYTPWSSKIAVGSCYEHDSLPHANFLRSSLRRRMDQGCLATIECEAIPNWLLSLWLYRSGSRKTTLNPSTWRPETITRNFFRGFTLHVGVTAPSLCLKIARCLPHFWIRHSETLNLIKNTKNELFFCFSEQIAIANADFDAKSRCRYYLHTPRQNGQETWSYDVSKETNTQG